MHPVALPALADKCDGVPGFESLWKGYARFYDMVEIVTLQRTAKSKEP